MMSPLSHFLLECLSVAQPPLPTTKLGVTEKELIIITEKRGKEISVSLCLDLDVQRHTTGRVWAERKVAFLSECQLASWRIAEII